MNNNIMFYGKLNLIEKFYKWLTDSVEGISLLVAKYLVE